MIEMFWRKVEDSGEWSPFKEGVRNAGSSNQPSSQTFQTFFPGYYHIKPYLSSSFCLKNPIKNV